MFTLSYLHQGAATSNLAVFFHHHHVQSALGMSRDIFETLNFLYFII